MREPENLCPENPTPSGREETAAALREYFANFNLDHIRGAAAAYPSNTINMKKAKKFLTHIEHLEGRKYEATLNFFGSYSIEFLYTGAFKEEADSRVEATMEGYAKLEVLPKLDCFRTECSLPGIQYIFGHFVEGTLTVKFKFL